MPAAADDPPLEGGSAELPAAPAADAAPEPAADAAPEPAAEPEPRPEGAAHRRRRRRRRPARETAGAAPADAASAAVTADEPPAGDATNPDAGPDERAVSHSPAPAADALDERPPRRRRRRRRPPRPGVLGSALPPAEAAPESDDAPTAGDGSGRPTLHLRVSVRPRRRLPRPPGLERGPVSGEAVPGIDGSAGEAGTGAGHAETVFPRRRRRRRPPLQPGEGPATATARPAEAGSTEAGERPQARDRNRRRGDERRHPGQGQRAAVPQRSGESGRGPRGPGADSGRSADRDRAARSRDPRRGRDGQRGRGRDAAPRRVEQKLYALEAMVDRGFEDVADENEDSGTRRVHWTIVKRSVADQKSGKPMSATYVLQREGEETEYPNLAAARAAANKTIVHPEKLTMSKAEHAAAKTTNERSR